MNGPVLSGAKNESGPALHRRGGASGRFRRGAAAVFKSIACFFIQFVHDIKTGDVWVRLSLLFCGAGYFGRRQFVRGILVTVLQAVILYAVPSFFWPYMSKFGTLGTVKRQTVFNPATMKNEVNDYDNSFLILLFGIIGFLVILTALFAYVRNIRTARSLQEDQRKGKHMNAFRDDIHDFINGKFHITLLSLPCLGVLLFTIVPLIVIILVAFTNYDKTHMVPTNLFTWVGFINFKTLFTNSLSLTFGYSFRKVLTWTLIWAFVATFSNYYAGILLAMFINNKKTYAKKLWRTCFVVTIAVPQFVSLLLVRNFFADTGIVNTLCAGAGITDFLKEIGLLNESYNYIPFLTDGKWAKVMIILINMWVGIPYLMLMCTGILMNIPSDLLESAEIDGANSFQRFRKITMPYIKIVTGPYLIASIVGNINNFNVIYLLTNDFYTTKDQLLANSSAREVDLLVTWLYRLTQDYYNFKMASVIGIFVFVICAVFTLIAFRRMIRGNREETFQ